MLVVCAVLAVVAGTAYSAAATALRGASARSTGTVTGADGDVALLRWTPPGSAERTDPVRLAGAVPPAGTPVEVAYDPAATRHPLIPGAAVLADADSALGTLFLVIAAAGIVLVAAGWQVVSRRAAAARPARTVAVRRVRIRSGMLARSFLEIEHGPPRLIPVHFDPVLVAMPSPHDVLVHGDPLRDRLVTVQVDGRTLHPSGPVRRTEPRGRRTDNPARPDAAVVDRAARLAPLHRQLLADAPLALPVPLVAGLWTYIDGGGLGTWLATTALLATLALWLAALRGSDPSG